MRGNYEEGDYPATRDELIDDERPALCHVCGGSGVIRQPFGSTSYRDVCTHCQGEGIEP